MASQSDHFDLQQLNDLFEGCFSEDGDIGMDHYVNAYDELTKLLHLMGTVFGFVNADILEKVGILRDYRKSSESDHYATIQGMISFEVKNNSTKSKHKKHGHPSGARTLLRLHRALEFMVHFMREVKEAEEHSKLSHVGAHSYNETLAKHHPWLVRKGVGLAMYTLPTRTQLLEKMKIEDKQHTELLLGQVADKGEAIFKIVEDLYAANRLLDLP